MKLKSGTEKAIMGSSFRPTKGGVMRLTDRQKDVLDSLLFGGYEWYTPLMIGGTDGSWHSAVLAQLVKKGLVEERERNTLLNSIYPGRKRASKEYRITNTKMAEHLLSEWE